MKADFVQPIDRPSNVLMVVSYGQSLQRGEALQGIIRLLLESENVSTLTIIIASNLARHYRMVTENCSEEAAQPWVAEQDREWLEGANALVELQTLRQKLSVNIFTWQEYIEQNAIQEIVNQKKVLINTLYATDKYFKKEVGNLSSFFANKQSEFELKTKSYKEAAKQYLLEECAMRLVLSEGEFDCELYPGNQNKALRYVSSKYAVNLKWVIVKISGREKEMRTVVSVSQHILDEDFLQASIFMLKTTCYDLSIEDKTFLLMGLSSLLNQYALRKREETEKVRQSSGPSMYQNGSANGYHAKSMKAVVSVSRHVDEDFLQASIFMLRATCYDLSIEDKTFLLMGLSSLLNQYALRKRGETEKVRQSSGPSIYQNGFANGHHRSEEEKHGESDEDDNEETTSTTQGLSANF